MKKKILIFVLIAVIVAAGTVAAFKFDLIGGKKSAGDGSSEIYVMALSDIMGENSSYTPEVFMGVVEGQETTSITKSSEREIEKLFVAEGDTVSKDTPLFSYKTDTLAAENTQYEFDIEGYRLEIDNHNREIAKLQADIAKIKGQTDEDKNNREDMENQIEGLKTDIAITENSIKQTQVKIEDNKRKMNNSTVKSSVEGVITKIADDTNPYTTDGSYITILASKEMTVKGQVNEQNVSAINVDEPVTLRSRVDSTKTWKGKITKIDTETKPEENENEGYGGASEGEATKYPFYIALESSDGLMMGQHLYVELGVNGGEEMDFTNGTYIYDYYLAYDEGEKPFVWASEKGKLVKKPVELGEFFEDQMVYSVKGIDKDTLLAYPMDDFEEGMKTVVGKGM